jgi:hypothetical protein
MRQKSTTAGYISLAEQDSKHPLQTRLSLILTDFEPNGNKQGIPKSEAENIIRYAQNQPIKINFDGDGWLGHTGAIPIGPIINAYAGQDKGRDVIFGEAIVWDELYKDVAEQLKAVFQDGIGTSWEIYFESAEKDDNGIEWLKDTVFGAQCIVEVPAYGPNRTRILAIAEKLEQDMSGKAQSDVSMDETRNELTAVQDLLFRLWEGVDQLFNRTFEIEAASVEKDIGKIADSFAEKISKIADRLNELSTKTAELESVKAELTTLKEEKDKIERDKLVNSRWQRLKDAGLEVAEDKMSLYTELPEESFTAFVDDISRVSRKPQSSTSELIPEPLGKSEVTDVELVEALKQELNKKR